MQFKTSAVLSLGLLVWAGIGQAQTPSGASWSQFRGPDARGIATGTQALPVEFDPSSNVVWKCALPAGNSSPCIVGTRIFLTAHDEDKLETICIDREDGSILWRRSVEPTQVERSHRINGLASPTPTSDGERVYVYFGSYGLLCYDLQGEIQWEREIPLPRNLFGSASSPILAGGHLIFANDQKEGSYLEAIEPTTGETVWKKDRSGFTPGWSTPVVLHHDGVEELVVYGAWWMTAYDLTDGSERWAIPGLTDEPCITPVPGAGLVFLTSYNMRTNPEVIGLPPFEELLTEYDTDGNGTLTLDEVRSNQSILSRIDADGEGDHPLRGFFRYLDEDRDGEIDITEYQKMFAFLNSFEHANALIAVRPGHGERDAEIVWQFNRGVPECPSPLYVDGRIYMIKNGGIASCLDAESGELKYQERLDSGGPYYSSPVVGDGKIYAASARGIVTVYETGDTLKVLARNDLDERIMATPALLEGRVYLRTEQALYAFGLPQ